MEVKKRHHSSNRDLLLSVVRDYPKSFSVKEIQTTLTQNGKKIGSSTLYRLLDEFTKDNIIAKDVAHDDSVYYRYLEPCKAKDHCCLQCTKCHKTIHIDCLRIAKLAKHLSQKHDFSINNSDLVIYGTCEDCR